MLNVLFGNKQSKITTKKLNFGSFNELLYSIVESRNFYSIILPAIPDCLICLQLECLRMSGGEVTRMSENLRLR